ncbi:MAG: hypothetical protein CMB64_05010 [Euryarchaeota archaeon]|nr:hypothetical protein [Euryarchaeota archaeon]
MQRNVQLVLIVIALLFVLTLAGYWMEWEWMPLGESIYGFYDSIVSYFSGEDETTGTGTANQSPQNPVETKATETNAETSQVKGGTGAASDVSTAAVGISKTIGDKKYQCLAQDIDPTVDGENAALCAQHTMKKGMDDSEDCGNQEGDMLNYNTGEKYPGKICYWHSEPA